MPQDNPLKSNIFYKFRKVISSFLILGMLSLYGGILPIKTAKAASPVDINIPTGGIPVKVTNPQLPTKEQGTLSTSNTFSNFITEPLKALGQGLQNFDYAGVLKLILRNGLNKVIDNFYNNVAKTFEDEYRVKDWFVDAWTPGITRTFSKWHNTLAQAVGGQMQGPLLDVLTGFESLVYKGAVATGRGLNTGVLKGLENLIMGTKAESEGNTDEAKNKQVPGYGVGTPQYFNYWAERAGESAVENAWKVSASVLGQEQAANADLERQYAASEGLSKVSTAQAKQLSTPLNINDPLVWDNNNSVFALAATLSAWDYTEKPMAAATDVLSQKGQFGVHATNNSADSGYIHIWSWDQEKPVKIGFTNTAVQPQKNYHIGSVTEYSPTDASYIKQLPTFQFSSNINSPNATGWTGLIERPGAAVKNILNKILDQRLGKAGEADDLGFLGNTIAQVMSGFTSAVNFTVKRGAKDSPMAGCPVGFEGNIKDLTKEIGPFQGQTGTSFACLMKAWDTYGWSVFDRMLKYVGCMAKKLLCWIFQVDNPNQIKTYEMVDDPNNPGEKIAVLNPDGTPKELAAKDNRTETYLQRISQYFIYTQLVKPMLESLVNEISGDDLISKITSYLSDKYGFLATIISIVGDVAGTYLTAELANKILSFFGWCEDCEKDAVNPGNGNGETCANVCTQAGNQDSIVFTGNYKVYYYGYKEDGAERGPGGNISGHGHGGAGGISTYTVVSESLNGPLFPGQNGIKFQACNCTVNANNLTTYDGMVGFDMSLTSAQNSFEGSLNEAQNVIIGKGHQSDNPNYLLNTASGVIDGNGGTWLKNTYAYVPNKGTDPKEGMLIIDVGREAVPRYLNLEVKTHKVGPNVDLGTYSHDAFFDGGTDAYHFKPIPIAAHSFFGLPDYFQANLQDYANYPLPELREPNASNQTYEMLPGKTYDWKFYVKNKTPIPFGSSGNPFLRGELKLAPIDSESTAAAECIELITTSESIFPPFGAINNVAGVNIYNPEVKADATNSPSPSSSLSPSPTISESPTPPITYPSQVPSTGTTIEPAKTASTQSPKIMDKTTIKLEISNGQIYTVITDNGKSTVTGGTETGRNIIKYVMDGMTYFGMLSPIANKGIDGLLSLGQKIENSTLAKSILANPGTTTTITYIPTDSVKNWSENHSGSSIWPYSYNNFVANQPSMVPGLNGLGINPSSVQPGEVYSNVSHPNIQKNNSAFSFKVKNDPACKGKVAPFALYLYSGNNSAPLSVIPVWFKLGPIDFHEPTVVPLTLDHCAINRDNCDQDGCTDRDGIAQPGEDIRLDVYLKNTAGTTVIKTQATLTTTSNGITINPNYSKYSYRLQPPPNNIEDNGRYYFNIPTTYPANGTIPFNLKGNQLSLDTSNTDLGILAVDANFNFNLGKSNSDSDLCTTGTTPPPSACRGNTQSCGGSIGNCCSGFTCDSTNHCAAPSGNQPDLTISNRYNWGLGDSWVCNGSCDVNNLKINDRVRVDIEVENIGNQNIPSSSKFDIQVWYRYGDSGAFQNANITVDGDGQSLTNISGLNIGKRDLFVIDWNIQQAKNLYFMFKIDSSNKINESSENNNEPGGNGEYKIPIGAETPPTSTYDAEVVNVTLDSFNLSNRSVRGGARLKNNSNVTVAANEFQYGYKVMEIPYLTNQGSNGCYQSAFEIFNSAPATSYYPLSAGEEVTRVLDSGDNITIVAGKNYQIRVETNILNHIETNMNNNVRCSSAVYMASANLNSHIAGVSTNQKLTLGQRIGRVLEYLKMAIFH